MKVLYYKPNSRLGTVSEHLQVSADGLSLQGFPTMYSDV